MPASVADPVALVLRTALSGKKGPFSQEGDNDADLLEDRLAASAKRVLLTSIEYEPAPKQQTLVLDSLKSKYVVLTSSNAASKIAAIKANCPTSQHEMLPPPKVVLFHNEDVKIGWRNPVPVGAGMVNMGNTCYMNSTLQALFHVPSLSNWLLNGRHCRTCDQNGTQQCVVCIIARTLQSTHEKTGSAVKPLLVYNRLKMICKHMVHGRQEDAHEFMRYLIESMEKAYLHSVGGMKLDTRSKETNPLGQIFGGYIRTEVACLKCKHTSTTFQHFQEIPLDIQHSSSLDDALCQYFRRERLEGENAYRCDKCKSKVPATKKFSIERSPNVLCIQLKRFGLMGGKMSKHIQFARHLNMSKYLFSQQSNGTLSYKFVSLINHMGPSQHCGHYTAIAEASNGQLYLFDDCSVRLVSLNVALSTGAYVLIYERVNSAPAQSKLNGVASATSAKNGALLIKTNGIGKPAVIPCLPARNNSTTPVAVTVEEETRPKINFELKKNDGNQKPRLVIRNGCQTLFKSTTVNGNSAMGTGSVLTAPATDNKVVKSPPKNNKVALVPYDNESDDDCDVKLAVSAPTTATIGGASNDCTGVVLKATETTWQVSQSPTPSESSSNVNSGSNAVPMKWHVSDNSQQDCSSSSSAGSGAVSSKWLVRSVSDTEAETCSSALQKSVTCSSDTEINSSEVASRKGASTIVKIGRKMRVFGEKLLAISSKKVASMNDSASGVVGAVDTVAVDAVSEIKREVSQEMQTAVVAAGGCTEAKDVQLAKPGLPPVQGGKCSASSGKWDGSRSSSTVKELLRMSHSGYDDQVRTWDGGKSHLTKQVEDDKRLQRKRTIDEIYDQDFDKGKVKKVKEEKTVTREASPPRSGYTNPFQLFQNRKKEQPYAPFHGNVNGNAKFKDQYRHHNPRSRGHKHGNGGAHARRHPDQHRPYKSNSWRRYR